MYVYICMYAMHACMHKQKLSLYFAFRFIIFVGKTYMYNVAKVYIV